MFLQNTSGPMTKREIAEDTWIIDNFLSLKECADLIQLSEEIGYEAAKVNINGRQVNVPMVRDNERVLHFDKRLAENYWEKLKPEIPKIGNSYPIGLNELWRFYKYFPGNRFKKHRDGSYARNEKEASFYTILIYLNSDFEGGETGFDDMIVKPETGMALIFDHNVRHEGIATTSGIKYVLRSDIMYRLNFYD
jgi:prolyl 4-hydroxylase